MATLELVREHTYETSHSPAESAHIVMKGKGVEDQTPQAYVLRALVEGFPVEALCGYMFVPKRDPKKLPVCEPCLEIYHQPGENRDDREALPDA